MRVAKIENDQFILPLSDDIEEESYSIDMLLSDFVDLLLEHGYGKDQVEEALKDYLANE